MPSFSSLPDELPPNQVLCDGDSLGLAATHPFVQNGCRYRLPFQQSVSKKTALPDEYLPFALVPGGANHDGL